MLSSRNLLLICLPLSVLFTSCEEEQPQPQPAPQEPFSAPALELDHIKTPTTLEDRNSDPNVIDYFANKTIAVSAELTIKPGVVIGFAEDTRLEINGGGILLANGTAEKKIKFVGKTAQKGFWAGIIVYSNASANTFSHAEIAHAGSKSMLDGTKTALALFEQARVTILNTSILQSGGYGIYLRSGSMLVNFGSNNLNNNLEAPMLVSANHISRLDEATVFSASNGRNVVEVQGSLLDGTSEALWPAFADGTPIRLLGTLGVRTGWKLKPGTKIEVAEDKLINIESNGYMSAIGTAAAPITISGVAKTTGTWTGIAIYTGSTLNELNHVKLQHAGGNALFGGLKAGISQFGTSPTNLVVRNSEISHSGGYGIHVFGNKAVLNADVETSNVFANNLQGKVYYAI